MSERTPASSPDGAAADENPLLILKAVAITKATGNRRYRTAGATYHVGREQDGEQAQVRVEQMSPFATSDPRTIVTANMPGTGLQLSEVHRPPITAPESVHELVIVFAEAVIAANAAMGHIRQQAEET